MKEINAPTVEIQMEDPTFEASSVHYATVPITNNASAQLEYTLELYLGVTKVASSGIVSVTIPAGGVQPVNLSVAMPLVEGTYTVYIDVWHEGTLVVHGQATEDVIITVTPDVSIGDITWG